MPEKVAQFTDMVVIDAVAKYAWNDGPIHGHHDMASIARGSDVLMESTHATWSAFMKQMLEGHFMVMHIRICGYY